MAPLLSFYGDDYTGSSAVMEVLSFAGVPTVLFMDAPKPDQLERFKDYRAIGIAGISRSQSPAWMDEHLPPLFRALAALNAPISHYKVCSTFDSAPHIGSIGKAIELAEPILGGTWHPMVVGAPAIARYQSFGTLFAGVNGTVHRLDQHPVMAHHPVTPMNEAYLPAHLAKQTDMPSGLIDLVALKNHLADARLAKLCAANNKIIFIDVFDEETQLEAGRLIWQHRGEQLFAIGSQGVEYALVAHWRSIGLLPPAFPVPQLTKCDKIAVVSGSCSPITAAQIAYALENGFAGIRLDATLAVEESAWSREIARAIDEALAALELGQSPLLYTASGPADPAIAAFNNTILAHKADTGIVNARIGSGLGLALKTLVQRANLKRVIISGGDTSGHAGLALGLYAVTAMAPLAPGSPMCRAFSSDSQFDGLEIAFKGGQMGKPDFFVAAKG